MLHLGCSDLRRYLQMPTIQQAFAKPVLAYEVPCPSQLELGYAAYQVREFQEVVAEQATAQGLVASRYGASSEVASWQMAALANQSQEHAEVNSTDPISQSQEHDEANPAGLTMAALGSQVVLLVVSTLLSFYLRQPELDLLLSWV